MKTNGNGSGHGNNHKANAAGTETVKNPYRVKPPQVVVEPSEEEDVFSHNIILTDAHSHHTPDEIAPPNEENKRGGKRAKKAVTIAAVMIMLLLIGAVALFLVWKNRTNIAYQTKPTGVSPRSAQEEQQAQNPTGQQTQAIKETREIFGKSGETSKQGANEVVGMKDQAQGTQIRQPHPVTQSPAYDPEAVAGMSVPNTAVSGTVSGANKQQNTQANQNTAAKTTTATTANQSEVSTEVQPAPLKSQRNPEHSIHLAAPDQVKQQVTTNTAPKSSVMPSQPRAISTPNNGSIPTTATPKVVLPSFGSMLPIRTLGAVYTLRNGSLTRFELTRDVKGAGWSMKRGTVLVGISRGGEFNRAYVNVVGFIDPDTNRLVRISGDVLGSDGGTGLKGKRRSLDGGWQKFIGSLAPSAINAAGLMVSGLGKQNVVVADAFGYRLMNPVSQELSGMARQFGDRRQQKGFVEVSAGAPGYVLINDLPKEIKGVDAVGAMDTEELESSSDPTIPRASTGLSEQELADLLSGGSPDDIRAAMPRMTPQMRRLAEKFLNEQQDGQ